MPFYLDEKVATLQVQAHKRFMDKRVYLKASLTIEVAMSLTFFLVACISLVFIFDMLDVHRKLQARIDKINMDACMYTYYLQNNTSTSLEKIDTKIELPTKVALISLAGLGAVEEGLKKVEVNNIKCDFLEDKETISIYLSYKYKLPYSFIYNKGINQEVFSKRRAYIGKVKRAKENDNNKNEEDDEWVYIGKTSKRYHRSSSCHYLSNDIKAFSIKSLENERNKNGAKYSPCARCIQAGNKPLTVYVMPSGLSYHSSKNCSAIVAYVRRVKKSEVEHMGECSYCGGGK